MKGNYFDQFYTNPLVSDELVCIIKDLFPSYFDNSSTKFIEPSAGSGNFLTSLLKLGVKQKNLIAYDIDPKTSLCKKADYLKTPIKFNKKNLVIGNPPFGKKGLLALEFLNKSLSEADIVAMIFPKTFNRYSIQNKVQKNAKLIYSKELCENAFIVNDKEYGVKTVFQIWTHLDTFIEDRRILTKPSIKHDHFKTFIHNNTKNTLKYFDKKKYGWDFAVVRQGYYDYNEKITDPKKLKKNRQYIFVKYIDPISKLIFEKIDFSKLSQTNTQVLGFSTTDLVKEYDGILKMEVKGEN